MGPGAHPAPPRQRAWFAPTCPPFDVTVMARYHDEPPTWRDGALVKFKLAPA